MRCVTSVVTFGKKKKKRSRAQRLRNVRHFRFYFEELRQFRVFTYHQESRISCPLKGIIKSCLEYRYVKSTECLKLMLKRTFYVLIICFCNSTPIFSHD